MADHLIIIGASARAAAQSAIRAGYSPWCIDLFADVDLRAIAPVKRCPRERWPRGILGLMEDAPPGPVLLTGGMENHIDIVRGIESQRPLFTGPTDAITRLRSPRAAHRALVDSLANWSARLDWREGIANVPAVNWDDDLAAVSPHHWQRILLAATARGERFLVKPRRGTGGRGVRVWSARTHITEDEYVQHHRAGKTFSAAFVAEQGRTQLLGISEQIDGDPAFAAPSPFAYVGNIVAGDLPELITLQFQCAGRAFAEWSGIRGVFGIDAVLPESTDASYPLNNGRIHILDINPRYTASMELLDPQWRRGVLGDTATMTLHGPLPADRMRLGKAVVYTRSRCRLPSPPEDATIGDIPYRDQAIEAGQPLCTVFARGHTRDACYAGLREMAEKVYTRLQPA